MLGGTGVVVVWLMEVPWRIRRIQDILGENPMGLVEIIVLEGGIEVWVYVV